MPRGNLLNTADVTLKGLLANGLRYSVPLYQRDYSWREEHWEDLWLDLEEVSRSDDAQHYMGAIVLQPRNREEFVVIDGQQRLCTLSLIALAAVALLDERARADIDQNQNEERARLLRDGFLGTKDPGSLLYRSKLGLNKNDDTFYQGTLLQLYAPLAKRRNARVGAFRLAPVQKRCLKRNHLALIQLQFSRDEALSVVDVCLFN